MALLNFCFFHRSDSCTLELPHCFRDWKFRFSGQRYWPVQFAADIGKDFKLDVILYD
jgi:hypothetical protein